MKTYSHSPFYAQTGKIQITLLSPVHPISPKYEAPVVPPYNSLYCDLYEMSAVTMKILYSNVIVYDFVRYFHKSGNDFLATYLTTDAFFDGYTVYSKSIDNEA